MAHSAERGRWLQGCSVLLCGNFLQAFSGSELILIDLCRYFSEAGARVTVAALQTREDFYSPLVGRDVRVVDLAVDADSLRGARFDLLWGLHWPVVGYLEYVLDVAARSRVMSSLSPFEPLECFPLPLDRADAVLFNSAENMRSQAQSLPPAALARVRVMPNPVSREWCLTGGNARREAELKRLLVISNHPPEEALEAVELLRGEGVEVDVIGQHHRSKLLLPADVDSHDAAMTIGHSVQKALVRGCPVYCYDRFGGPGWLVGEGMESAAEFNFSGRCVGRRIGAGELVTELKSGFLRAQSFVVSSMGSFAWRFSLERHVTALLQQIRIMDKVACKAQYSEPTRIELGTPRKLVLLYLRANGIMVDWVPSVCLPRD